MEPGAGVAAGLPQALSLGDEKEGGTPPAARHVPSMAPLPCGSATPKMSERRN